MSLRNLPFGDYFSFLLGKKTAEPKKDDPDSKEKETGEEKNEDKDDKHKSY
jgi:hypothetical protein